MPPFVPPRWLAWACASVMLVGLLLFIGGPILSMTVASSAAGDRLTAEEQLDPKLREEAYAAALAERRESDAWVIPVGLALTGMGTMGLLFVFVTRPMGNDLDEPADLPTEQSANESTDQA